MEQILSKDNSKLKNWIKLKQTKYVHKTNKVLLEGKRIVDDAFKRGAKFEAVLTNFDTKQDFGCEKFLLNESAFNALSETKTPQGIIAVVNMEKQEFKIPKGNFLILDGVSDPGNMGTIIRTAVACDFEIYMFNCVDFRNQKVLRSTMGTIFDAKIYELTKENLEKLKDFQIFCADMSGESVFNTEKPKGQFGIVFGNEANGIGKEFNSFNFKKISLPMKNNVESLNVAISCGIMMYVLGRN